MSRHTPSQIARSAVERYRGDFLTFSRFVAELEQAVSEVEGASGAAAPQLRRIWGQLEIINALSLDEGILVPREDPEVDDLIELFLATLHGDVDGERDVG
jgi:hypothetical protein